MISYFQVDPSYNKNPNQDFYCSINTCTTLSKNKVIFYSENFLHDDVKQIHVRINKTLLSFESEHQLISAKNKRVTDIETRACEHKVTTVAYSFFFKAFTMSRFQVVMVMHFC